MPSEKIIQVRKKERKNLASLTSSWVVDSAWISAREYKCGTIRGTYWTPWILKKADYRKV